MRKELRFASFLAWALIISLVSVAAYSQQQALSWSKTRAKTENKTGPFPARKPPPQALT